MAWARRGRRRADDGGQPRHPRHPGGRRPARVLQPPGRHRLVGPAGRARRREAARHQALVPGQRDGRPLADRPQDRRRVRPARRRDRQGDAPGRRPASSWSPCGSSNAAHADLRRVGGRACSSTPTTQVDYISLHAYYEQHDGDLASFLASSIDMDRLHRRGGRDRRPRGRQAAQPTRRSSCPSTSGTSGTSSASPASAASTSGGRAELIEDDVHRARRGRRRQPADHPAPARRPGGHRLPGAAGQRHRADPHRARRPGLAADASSTRSR